MNTALVTTRVLLLFMMMLPAVALKKSQLISDSASVSLSNILLYVTNPILIVSSYLRPFDAHILGTAGILLGASLVLHLGMSGLAEALFRRTPPDEAAVLRYMTVFSNAGFIGFPVLQVMFGGIGVLYGSAYVTAYYLLNWPLAIWYFQRKRSDALRLRTLFLNPSMIAVYISLLFFLTGWGTRLPNALLDTLHVMGNTTAPLSMFVIGMEVCKLRLGDLGSWKLWGATVLRLVVIPLSLFLVLRPFAPSTYLLWIPLVAEMMPCAAVTPMFAQRFGGNVAYASRCVVVSTALSVVTIPLLLLLFSILS